jgi:hypothetical protein
MQQDRVAVESSTAAPQVTEPSPEKALSVRSEVSSSSFRSYDRGVALAEKWRKARGCWLSLRRKLQTFRIAYEI